MGAVDFAEEGIGATGAWKGCAEFRPDQAIGNSNHRAEHPGPYREPVACRCDDQGQRDEGPDADHLKHVEEDGGAQADATLEGIAVCGDMGGLRHEANTLTGLYTDGKYGH